GHRWGDGTDCHRRLAHWLFDPRRSDITRSILRLGSSGSRRSLNQKPHHAIGDDQSGRHTDTRFSITRISSRRAVLGDIPAALLAFLGLGLHRLAAEIAVLLRPYFHDSSPSPLTEGALGHPIR